MADDATVEVNPLDQMMAAEEAKLPGAKATEPFPTKEGAEPPTTPGQEPSTTETILPTTPQRVPLTEPAQTPAPPVVEVAPLPPPSPPPTAEPQPPPQQAPEHPTWRQLRAAEKELQAERQRARDLELRMAALEAQYRQPQEPQEQVRPEDMDPVTRLEQQNAMLAQQLAQVDQRTQAQELEHKLELQAQDFARAHPDYNQALQHYVESERKAVELSGELDMVARMMRERSPDVVRNLAMQRGTTEDAVSRDLALGTIFLQRRATIVAGAEAQGKTVPQLIYELAPLRGWKSAGTEPQEQPQAQPQPLPAEASPSAMIHREQAQASAASLSALSSASTAPPKVIRSRQDFLRLSPDEQFSYIEKMDAERPGWDRELI